MSQRPLLVAMLSFAFLTCIIGAVYADEAQKAWLRMHPENIGYEYIGDDPDAWLTDSFVIESLPVGSLSFTINISNHKGQNDIYDLVLTIVTNDTNAISAISVNETLYAVSSNLTWTWSQDVDGLNMTTDEGISLGYLPPHGIYNDPDAWWMEHRLHQNLSAAGSPGDSIAFPITIYFKSNLEDVKMHFDTYGWTEVETGKKNPVIIDDKLDAAFVPFSHDITILIPEFIFASSIVFSLGVCGYLLIKRKFTT